MTKKLIIKYFNGNATEAEEKAVIDWVNLSDNNLKYFISLKNLWTYQNMPNTRANASELEEIRSFVVKPSPNQLSKFNLFHVAKYAAASVIIILLGLNLFFIYHNDDGENQLSMIVKNTNIDSSFLNNLPSEYKHVLYTNNGVKGFVVLPDGSKVWLNSASKIVYPDKFLGNTREVIVSGEALFDVVPNPNKPMIVSTNRNFKVRVLGTKFNIRSYDNDDEAQTTLLSGSINLIRKSPVSGIEEITKLSPKESYVIKDNKTSVLIKQSDTSLQVAWKAGKLIFDSTPMLEVIKKLERWHGTEFIIKDKEILNFKFTANINSESIVQIMEMIRFCSLIDYSITNNRVTLYKRVHS